MPKRSIEEYTLVRKNILKKLYAHNAFSKGHLLEERLHSGIPKHLAGLIAEVLSDLVQEGLVIHYGKTKHGDAYQLNVRKLREIESIVLPKTESTEK
ncbi:hypothetical protein HY641_01810 [Candidatus Woesearchaeota archaeon]|nr:hypothetical protein [Candidatus Woesearchaeota archaeon]